MDNHTTFGYTFLHPERGTKRSLSDLERSSYNLTNSSSSTSASTSYSSSFPASHSRLTPSSRPSHAPGCSLFASPLTRSTRRFDFEMASARSRSRSRTQRSEIRDCDVIDLTSDDNVSSFSSSGFLGNASRGPRFANDIIDISEDNSDEGSPEVQFLSSRRLPTPPSRTLYPPATDQDLEITGSNVLNLPPMLPTIALPMGTRSSNTPMSYHSSVMQAAQQLLHQTSSAMGFVSPALNYTMTAFSYGGVASSSDRQETASPVQHKAPSAPPEGFTRSPEEGDVVVCPNCGDELCSGETDVKKQVWLVKACGHVYCGECTQGRFVSKKRSRAPVPTPTPVATKPFKECVIEDCNKKVSGAKSMIQLFL